MHMNSLASAFDYLRDRYPLAGIASDEALVTNNPYNNGQHLNDILLFLPVFHDGALHGFTGSVCHHLDMGGTAPLFADATDLIQEGFVIPAIKLRAEGLLIDGPFEEMLAANVRAPEMVTGDFRAQYFACVRGRALLGELIEKYGAETIAACMAETQDYSARIVRAHLAHMPDGEYEGEDFADGHKPGDPPIPVRVRAQIEGERAVVDLSGSSDQVNCPLNSPIASSQSAVYGFFASLMPRGTPVNDGSYRPIQVITRKGSICDPIPPAPVHSRMAVCYAISAALRRAFGAAAPELVAACGDDTSTGIVLSRRDGQGHRIHVEIVGGGNGASARADGEDGIAQCLANSSNMPVEALEANFGFVRVDSYGLIQDSGGVGMHRGGRGIRRRFEVIADGVNLHTTGDGHMTAPWGLGGGDNGTLSTKRVLRGNNTIELSALSTVALERGDIIEVETSGGGGFGDPRERPRERVRADLADGAISAEAARTLYGAGA